MIGVGRRDRRGAGQRQAQRLGDRHHGRGGAHHHAGAERARDAALDLVPFALRRCGRRASRPSISRRRSRSRACGRASCRAASGRPAHRSPAVPCEIAPMTRPGVVLSQPPISTAPSIGWLRSKLLGLHGEEIAVEHGRRFDERLGERHRRQFDRKAAGLPDAALDVFGARAQMAVAGVDVAPGVEDADDRLADPVGAVVADLLAAASDGRTSADRRARASDSCATPRAICARSCGFGQAAATATIAKSKTAEVTVKIVTFTSHSQLFGPTGALNDG